MECGLVIVAVTNRSNFFSATCSLTLLTNDLCDQCTDVVQPCPFCFILIYFDID